MKRGHWRLGPPFFSHPAKHTHSHTHPRPQATQSAQVKGKQHTQATPGRLGLPSTVVRPSPGSGSGAARPPVSVAPAHSWRRARGAGLGAAGGRGTGAGGGSSWPLARGLGGGDARLTSGPKTAREAAGKGGVEARGPEGVSWAGGAEDVVPRAGMGSLAPKRRCQGTDDFPNLPPGPPETEWEVQEEEQGKPLPRTAARAGHSGGRNWGWGGGESLRKQTWRPPQPAQGAALPAPNFKKGRCLFKFTPTPTPRTPSAHTPS